MKKHLRFYVYGLPTGGTTIAIIRLANVLIESFNVSIFSAWEPDKASVYKMLDKRVKIETFHPNVEINQKYPFGIRAIRWQFLRFFGRLALKNKGMFKLAHRFLEKADWEIGFTETEDVLRFLAWSHLKKEQKKLVIHTDFYQNAEMNHICNDIQHTIAEVVGETVAVSDYITKTIHSKVPNANVETCYNLVDFDNLIEQSVEYGVTRIDNAPHIICVGRFSPVKGHIRLLEAHMELLKRDCLHHLFFIGHGGADEKRVADFIENNMLSNTVHLTGYKDNPYPYFKMSDGLIQASFTEGLPTTLIEGLAFHLPMAATAVGGTKEILGISDEFGVVVENNSEGVEFALEKLVTDKKWREAMRDKNADKHMKQFYNPQKWINLFTESGATNND
ncbi:glycosyltransferase [Culicoidibacter larvae]|uniref:Glycosyltransferase n=1 Tax=Culicoidibacter larvae TaxID=2579976 RepID=A0A5R8QHG5_9FIRM|nr:glycosyltransferase [Culicoidibacter larvae]TLG77448.1 glycosyltransferase [Culicoidibacter larvae]